MDPKRGRRAPSRRIRRGVPPLHGGMAFGPAFALFLSAAVPALPAEPATGLAVLDTIPLPQPDFSQPVAVAAAPFGRLFVADPGRGTVLRLDARGRILFEFETPPQQPSLQPLDVAVTGFKVYVLDAQSNALLRYSDQGSFLDVLQSFRDAGGDTPRAVAVDPTGRVLLASPARHEVRLLDETQRVEAEVRGFGSRPGQLVRPAGVAFAPDGSFYVSDPGNARVQRFSGVGNFEAALVDSLREPRGLVVGGGGDLFVADSRRRSVHLYGPGGVHRAELDLGTFVPADVTVVGDTLWVLSGEPAALLRVRVLRGG